MPPSNEDDDIDWQATLARLRENKERLRQQGYKPIDPQVFADALNRATSTPEFTARYKAWLEYLGPSGWTPVARADYEKMCQEDVDPDLVAKYRAELEATRAPSAKATSSDEKMTAEEVGTEAVKQTESKK